MLALLCGRMPATSRAGSCNVLNVMFVAILRSSVGVSFTAYVEQTTPVDILSGTSWDQRK